MIDIMNKDQVVGAAQRLGIKVSRATPDMGVYECWAGRVVQIHIMVEDGADPEEIKRHIQDADAYAID